MLILKITAERVKKQVLTDVKEGVTSSIEIIGGAVKDNEPKVDCSSLNNTNLLTLYGQLITLLQYEGSGIWSRFNILVGIELSLFAAAFLLITSDTAIINVVTILTRIISVVGFIFSLWSILVLKRLWRYHNHWKTMLSKLEESFPTGWITSFRKTVESIKSRRNNFLTEWVVRATQPFFLVFSIFWIIIFIVSFFLLKNGG